MAENLLFVDDFYLSLALCRHRYIPQPLPLKFSRRRHGHHGFTSQFHLA
jgi:hypothetical protein